MHLSILEALSAAMSSGKSIKITCTLLKSTYFFLIFGTTFLWKFAQCGHVKDEKILIFTGASLLPSVTKSSERTLKHNNKSIKAAFEDTTSYEAIKDHYNKINNYQ